MTSRESTPTAPRRSGRERRPTKQFANEPNKRKRDTDDENASEKEDQDQDYPVSDPASDDEQQVEYAGPKPTARGTRGKRGRGGIRAGTRRKKVENEDGEDTNIGARLAKEAKISDDNALFNLILSPTTALQDTADNFLESLDETPAQSLAELINCVLRTCGCNSSVDADQVMDTDGVVDALDDFTEGVKGETMPAYPIASKNQAFRRFRKSLAEFFHRLVASSAELGSLYASDLMPILQAWIVPLSGSQIRSFRHTATVVALDIETALCQVAASVDKELQAVSRQRDAERGKKQNRSKARESELDNKTKEINERRNKLKEYLKDIFNAVFVHRSRDHDATIRADCVHELGVWFTKHPAHFIESGFLPYLGKTLSDQNAHVRLEAVKAISTLYSKKDYIVAVNHFTHTFKPRLVEMAVSDIEVSVRLAVVEILFSIDQLGFLETEEREQLCLLIFGQDQRVRQAVAPFIQLSWSEEMDEQLTGRPMSGEAGERENQRAGAKCIASLLLKWSKSLDEATATPKNDDDDDDEEVVVEKNRARNRLFDSITEKVNHDRIGLAVESLWDEMEFIRKWNGLLNLLLLDHSQEANSGSGSQPSTAKGKKKGKATHEKEAAVEDIWRLSEEEEDVLLQVLVAALRRATEDARSRKKSNKTVEPDDEDASVEDITLVLIKALPRLFVKHQTDANRISTVLVIPQLLNIGMYLEMRMLPAYETLWDDISKQLMTHPSPTVTRRAIGALKHLTAAGSLQNVNNKKISELEEDLARDLRKASKMKSRASLETATLDEDDVELLELTIYRIASLFSARNLVGWMEDNDGGKQARILDIFNGLVERAKLGNSIENQMIEHTISVLCSYILWKSHAVFAVDPSSAEGHALQQALKQQRDPIVDILTSFVIGEDSQVTDSIKRAAFLAIMSIHLVFCTHHPQDGSGNHPSRPDLQMVLEDETQFRLAGYIQAVIEEYDDQLKAEKQAARRLANESSDSEMEAEQTDKTKSKGKRTKGEVSSDVQPSLARLEKDYLFHSTVAAFIQAIRTDTILFEHSSVILAHYGRFGAMYDQLAKVLVEMLRAHWQHGDNKGVAAVVKSSMRQTFKLRVDHQVYTEEPATLLARTFSSHFILRGAHLAVLGRLPSSTLLDIHFKLIDYLANQLKAAEDDEDALKTVSSLFKPLAHLIANGTQPEDLSKLNDHLSEALSNTGVDTSDNQKHWDGLRAYERKLTGVIKEKVTTGKRRGRPKKDAASDASEVEQGLTDTADEEEVVPKQVKQPKPRTRPVRQRAAKDKASSAASSEAEEDEDAFFIRQQPPKPKPRNVKSRGSGRKSKGAKVTDDELEEEPDEAPVVLNGNDSPARGTPQLPVAGSARKRRRGSEELSESPSSQKRRKEVQRPPPEEDDDEDNFTSRRFKKIKR